ncbi:MAG TPA: DUF3108 domain-containing protein [Dissulfurispiraceae bacterium]|nr:DUF3108 domain-containing protein [Dissulfurispiraceae bacterium]
MHIRILLIAIIVLLTIPCGVRGFSIPERLEYALSWGGITVGYATLEAQETSGLMLLSSTARSTQFISTFYQVEDHVQARLQRSAGTSFGKPESYRIRVREGTHRRDKETTFDTAGKKILYADYLKPESVTFEYTPGVFDPLSSLYYVRTLDLSVGKSIYVQMFDSKKLYRMEIKVIKKERVQTPAGIFDTVLIQPVMLSEGIFGRKGDLLLWLTDDDKHIPVQMKSRVKIGSVTGQLTGGQY